MIALLCIVLIFFALAALADLRYKRTNHYANSIHESEKFMEGVPCHIKIANLGTTFAKYAFDWEQVPENGFNFAIAPQPFGYDYRVLRNYIGHFDEGAILFISCAIFSFCVSMFPEEYVNDKYYHFLKKENIQGYSSIRKLRKALFPVLSSREAVHSLFSDTEPVQESCSLENAAEARHQAESRKKSWYKEFEFGVDIQANTRIAKTEAERCCKYVLQIIDLCKQYGIQPVLLILPFCREEKELYSDDEMNLLLYDNVAKLTNSGVPCLDYFRDTRVEDWRYFMENGALNSEGRSIFTNLVAEDIRGLMP